MGHDSSELTPRTGMVVIGSDGDVVGEIDVVEPAYVIVRKGTIFPQDYYIAVSDIVSQDEDGRLRLAIPAEEALERGLGNPAAAIGGNERASDLSGAPAEVSAAGDIAGDELSEPEETSEESSGSRIGAAGEDAIHDEVAHDTGAGEDVVDDDVHPEPLHEQVDEPEIDATDEEPARDDMHRTVTLSQEELKAITRPVERGVVRVQKQVIEEQQTIEVPLVEDEVQVTRRRVDREITEDDDAFTERTIEVPLRGQGVEIEKRAHVVEEVEIGKTAHERTREVTETVRHETARIETDGAEVVEETPGVPDEDEGREL